MSVFEGLYRPKMRDDVFGTPADHVVGPIGIVLQVLRESGGSNRCST